MERGLKEILRGGFDRRVFIPEEGARTEMRFLTGRSVAWVIHECFKVSDADESVLEISEILKVDLKNDSVQPFNGTISITVSFNSQNS